MTGDFERLYADLQERAGRYGVRVESRRLEPETPAEFDGPTVTLDPGYDQESRCDYLARALGSIAPWSTDTAATRAVFGGLHAAERARERDPVRFDRAVAEHLAFGERSSGHAVWLLADLDTIGAYPGTRRSSGPTWRRSRSTTGRVAPVWREFFPAWKEKVARGGVRVPPFEPRPVHAFRAIAIPRQEVLREEGGEG